MIGALLLAMLVIGVVGSCMLIFAVIIRDWQPISIFLLLFIAVPLICLPFIVRSI
jgi:hypothetical protein